MRAFVSRWSIVGPLKWIGFILILVATLHMSKANAACPEPEIAPGGGAGFGSPVTDSMSRLGGVFVLDGSAALRVADYDVQAEPQSTTVNTGNTLILIAKFEKILDVATGTEVWMTKPVGHELTIIGIVKITAKDSGAVVDRWCYRFEPVDGDTWESRGAERPIHPGTVFRVFDASTQNFVINDSLEDGINSAQDGALLWELGFTGPNATAYPGEGADARPGTGDAVKPTFKFLSAQDASLRLALGVTAVGEEVLETGLLPTGHTNPLFGRAAQAQFRLTNWLDSNTTRGWHTTGAINLRLRPIRE